MAENGYAKPVLVTTEWLAEHLNDESVVAAEVDESATSSRRSSSSASWAGSGSATT